MLRTIFTLISLLLTSPSWADSPNITQPIAKFSDGTLHGWEEKEFDGHTQYVFTFDEDNQQKVLQATSSNGASGLFREIRIDLNKTPFLNWSWKTSSSLQGIDETQKSGDDFAARIYVVVDGGYFFWKTIALNYVWSSSHQKGQKWDNPFTSNATMYAVESGTKNLGKWQHYKRNILEDLKHIAGKKAQNIDAIAIMTDTDNSGLKATTSFGDIFFTSQ
ncbi:MAG: DUF3047 domain-containing protein [Ghiorsea sp.]